MGAYKKATQLKVVEGTNRSDRDSHGVVVAVSAPSCPVWLPKSAKKYWKSIVPELEKNGLISKIDSAFFCAYCDSVGRFEDITRELQTIEDMLAETPQGFLVQSALLPIRNKLWDQIKSGSNEFGLTPLARNRVSVSGQQTLEEDWNKF